MYHVVVNGIEGIKYREKEVLCSKIIEDADKAGATLPGDVHERRYVVLWCPNSNKYFNRNERVDLSNHQDLLILNNESTPVA